MAKSTSQQRKQESKGKVPSKYRDADKRQGRRFLYFWVPIIIVVLAFFYALVLDPPQPLGQPIPGTSRVAEKTQSGEAIGKAYTVVLDDGRIVKLDGYQMGSIEAGRRVLVQESITLIFKRKSFSFVRYLEEKQ